MKARVSVLIFCMLFYPRVSLAFFNPADTLALAQILANAIEQLVKLKQIVQTGKDNLEMLKDINQGISQALNLAQTVYPELEKFQYQDFKDVDGALKQLQRIYGAIPKSSNQEIYGQVDQGIAEAIVQNNRSQDHSRKVDTIGENIKSASLIASPKGAAKLTAQGVGVMIHVQNQSLRTQSLALKLQAQQMATESKQNKDEDALMLKTTEELKRKMSENKENFKTMRFQ